MKNILKVFNTMILALIIIIATFSNTANAADSGTLNYEVYKYNTNDTSIANDYLINRQSTLRKMVIVCSNNCKPQSLDYRNEYRRT